MNKNLHELDTEDQSSSSEADGISSGPETPIQVTLKVLHTL